MSAATNCSDCARVAALAVAALLLAVSPPVSAQQDDVEEWITLFNGTDLSNWVPKIRGHAAGVNFADTFRVENGVIEVSYAGYDDFDEQFGHLFFETPYSHYRLRLEYRFVGDQAPNAPEWAYRNSGVMLHSQAPATMRIGQDFPISVEVQFLGGRGDGTERTTGNVCTPGTHIVYANRFTDTHCIDSSSATFDGEQWVRSETLVLGSERIVHFINGIQVIEYGGITTGGGVVSDYDPAMKPEGQPLGSGFIALQSEGHPVHFRRIELLDLSGCMDPAASNFRSYFVVPRPGACLY
jgi:hypothetical protein